MDIIQKHQEFIQAYKEYEKMIEASLRFINDNLRGSPEEVQRLIDSLIPLVKEQNDLNSLARLYILKGWTYIDLSDYQTAKELFGDSLKILETLGDNHGIIRVYNSLGFCATNAGDITLALEYYDKALEIALPTDDRSALAMVYGNLGETFQKLGNFEEAIEYFKKSLLYASPGPNRAVVLEGVGSSYFNLGENEKALSYLGKALEIAEENKLLIIMSHILGSLSLVYENMGNFTEALKVLEKSKKLAQETNMTKIVGFSNLSFGRIYFKKKENDKALEYFQEAFAISEEVEGITLLIDSAKFISDIYKEEKDWQKAYDYFNIFFLEKQKMANEETAKEVQRHKLREANREIGLLKEMYQQISTVSQMGKEITSSLDLKEVMFTIYGILNDLMDATMFGIGIYNEWEKEIVFQLAVEDNEWFQPAAISLAREDSFAVKSFKENKEIIINDLYKEYQEHVDNIYSSVPLKEEKIQSLLYIPLKLGDKLIGVLTVQSSKKEAYDEYKVEMIKALASYIAIAVENSNLYEKVQKMAISDTVTNLLNRAYFLNLGGKEFAKFKRQGPAFSLIMFDLDYFKEINDRYGHGTGDQVLKHIAYLCKERLRESDLFSRYGGDEFTILLPATSLEEAMWLAESLLAAINAEEFYFAGEKIPLRASFGVSSVSQKDKSLKEVLKRADIALYESKNEGRNRVSAVKDKNISLK